MEEIGPIVETFREVSDGGFGSIKRHKIFDYGVVQAGTASEMRRKVLELYAQGFRPQGGIAFRNDGEMFQVVIKDFIQ